jgi:RNA polymerase sigma-70 factor (ECF subfamily)
MNAYPPNVDNPTATADIVLMERIKSSDGRALEELYSAHSKFLRSVIFRVLSSDVDSDEVLQEVFVEIWNRAATYDSTKGVPLAWLIVVARRRALDRCRRRAKEARHLTALANEMETSASSHFCPRQDTEVDRLDTRAVVEEVLLRLPEAQREVLRLAFYAGLSQRQIAAKIGIPAGTVKTRMQLGLEKVARGLKAFSSEYVDGFRRPAAI